MLSKGLHSEHIETRYFVRIRMGHDQLYYRNDMLPDFFFRWQWFFDYRAALVKVKNPRKTVYCEKGTYQYVLPENDYREKLRSLEIKRKAQLTQFNNKLKALKANWKELFPLEDHPEYKRILEKQNKLQQDYDIIQLKKEELKNGYIPDKILSYTELLENKTIH